MVLIFGVGDEVVQFLGVVLAVLVAALAWWSTNARPERYRTVLVMRSRTHHPVTVSIRTRNTHGNVNALNNTTQSEASIASDGPPVNTVEVERLTENPRIFPLQEMDSIMDADVAMISHHRLHFYRRVDTTNGNQSAAESTSDESEMQDDAEPASNAQIREMDSIVSAMEADGAGGNPNNANVTKDKDGKGMLGSTAANVNQTQEEILNTDNVSTAEVAIETPGDNARADARKILIKLKYLNDTLREVDGSLDELLKDFKWRHFATELRAQCAVRLILNGRVLADEMTLRACGLTDRAVVHCLVHPSRQQAQRVASDEPSLATHELQAAGAQPERTWDLENIFMTLISVALTVVWFFRCEYSNMFTASASVALFGLTVFYSVAIFAIYLSDTFHFDRRPAAPVPNN